MKGLVSIVTPCYNGGDLIHRLFDSILSQTYKNIEILLIDDGSTDNTKTVVESYIPKFAVKGYDFRYVYQPNSGQSMAINNGLKLFSGEYLVWPDCDDYYEEDHAIERMVNVLSTSGEDVGMVRCFQQILEENSMERIGLHKTTEKNRDRENLFEDCLFVRNGFWFQPGGYMAKRSAILEVIPDKTIYTSQHAGQNWQLMLPVFFSYKCLTIEEILYTVVARKDSHSRGTYQGFEKTLIKLAVHENTIISTLEKITKLPVSDQENLKGRIQVKYDLQKMRLFWNFRKKERFLQTYTKLYKSSPGNLSKKDNLKYMICRLPFSNILRTLLLKGSFLLSSKK